MDERYLELDKNCGQVVGRVELGPRQRGVQATINQRYTSAPAVRATFDSQISGALSVARALSQLADEIDARLDGPAPSTLGGGTNQIEAPSLSSRVVDLNTVLDVARGTLERILNRL